MPYLATRIVRGPQQVESVVLTPATQQSSAEIDARDPLAHPVSPRRPANAARPILWVEEYIEDEEA